MGRIKKMCKLDKSEKTLYRVIVEKSGMINNDTHVMYIPKNQISSLPAQDIAMSRPVHKDETGLDFSYRGEDYEEKVSDITLQLDSIYRLQKYFTFWKKYGKDDIKPSQWIGCFLGSNYYDCMSGGSYKWDLILLKTVLTYGDFDMSAYTYQSNNKEITLSDFMKDVPDIPIIEKSQCLPLLEVLNQ